MVFELPELGYGYDALEPFIDARTMEIHHTKHHKAYADNFNKALEGHEEIQGKSAEEIIANINFVSEKIKTAIRNNGGGYINHNFFWTILKKDTEIKGEILEEIKKAFGGFEEFKTKFGEEAMKVFGSGWAWLVLNPQSKTLEIVQTRNQDSPLSEGKIPLLAIDVWEHAYYLKYQNKRVEYVENFFNVINWDKVNEIYVKAMKE
ncbi:superoxide dismutase [Candidatus Pacearchaeota archaeon CG10_big_fil_rev_8_21_14_0_10_34_12]|nr:MAG: superoxide dismutase [Candidatus Pacearchaeota archaeon CG10_big_fil_rev_8_21_14_0_10_34_12]